MFLTDKYMKVKVELERYCKYIKIKVGLVLTFKI